MELSRTTNPVGFLQEYCQKQYLPPPQYILIKEDGFNHCRTFTMSCKLEDHCVNGTSHSKKLAKKEAAHNMVTYLTEKGCDSTITTKFKVESMDEVKTPEMVDEVKTPETVDEEMVPIQKPCFANPIGTLQEYCAKQRLMLPIYKELPHESEMFVISCKFEELTFYGTGRQKKLAKSVAASKVLEAINEKRNAPKEEEKMEIPNTVFEEEKGEMPDSVPEVKEHVAENGSMSPSQSFIAD